MGTGMRRWLNGVIDTPARCWVSVTALLLQLVGLALPTCTRVGGSPYVGMAVVETSWPLVVAFDPAKLVWWAASCVLFANLLIYASVIAAMAEWRLMSRIAAVCAFLNSLPLLSLCGSEIVGLPGYWVWLASAGVLFGGSWLPWVPSAASADDEVS